MHLIKVFKCKKKHCALENDKIFIVFSATNINKQLLNILSIQNAFCKALEKIIFKFRHIQFSVTK